MTMISRPGSALSLHGLIVLMCVTGPAVGELVYEAETRLQTKLFDNYNKNARPAENASLPVTIDVVFYLIRIGVVDTLRDMAEVDVVLLMTWNDSRLTWNPADYLNLTHYNVPKQRVWIPDIGLYNSADQSKLANKGKGDVTVTGETGTVWCLYNVEATASCRMDIYNFPFDEQTCYLAFGTWFLHRGGIVLRTEADWVEGSSVGRQNDWQVVNTSLWTKGVSYAQTVKLVMRRHPTFYLHLYVVPPVVISLLTPVIFLLQTTELQRSALGMGIILSMTFLTGGFGWVVPSAGGMPRLGRYYAGSLATAVLAFMISVGITAISERSAKLSGPPAVVMKVVGDLLGSLLCITRAMSGGVTLEADTEASRTRVVDTKDESKEWLHLARVLDRVFFILFTLVFFILTMACLIN